MSETAETETVPEVVNVAGLDNAARLRVFVYNPDPILCAVDRARLYQAAPELLAACRAARECIEHGAPPKGDYTKSIAEQLRAAIAKATQ